MQKNKAITKIQGLVLAVILIVAVAAALTYYLTLTPTSQKVVIGGSLGLSGTFASISTNILDAFTAWENMVNDEGGIYVPEYGKKVPVEIKIYDDESKPELAATLYEKLITEDKVDAIIAPFSSGCTLAVAPIAEKYKLPLVAHRASSDQIYTQGLDYVFQTIPCASRLLYTSVKSLTAIDPIPSRIGIVVAQTEATLNMADVIKTLVAEEPRLEVVVYEEYAEGVTDLSDVVEKLRSANVNCLYGLCRPPGATLLTKNMIEMGWRADYIYYQEGPREMWFPEQFGKDSIGFVYVEDAMVDRDDPLYKKFSQYLRDVNPEWTGDAQISDHVQPAEALNILKCAIEEVGLDGETIGNFLRAGNKITGCMTSPDHEITFGTLNYLGKEYKWQNLKADSINAQIQDVTIENGAVTEVLRKVVFPEGWREAPILYPVTEWPGFD